MIPKKYHLIKNAWVPEEIDKVHGPPACQRGMAARSKIEMGLLRMIQGKELETIYYLFRKVIKTHLGRNRIQKKLKI